MLESLAPRLALLDYFAFDSYASWQVLIPHFHALDISAPVSVYYPDYSRVGAFSSFMPPALNDFIPWPLLHLTLVLDNLLAFKATLSHPQFRPESIHEKIAGFSLKELFDACDEAEIYTSPGPIGFSISFRSALQKYFK